MLWRFIEVIYNWRDVYYRIIVAVQLPRGMVLGQDAPCVGATA